VDGLIYIYIWYNTQRLRQEDCEFEANLGYTVRPGLQKPKERNRK
jgi:hypothetical protein